jgi:hypothetical protein
MYGVKLDMKLREAATGLSNLVETLRAGIGA